MEVLRLENLSKYYTSKSGVVMGLSSVNLSFSVGEFVAITGESGSGKSTLAHVLGGIIPYESGELYINGTPTSHYDGADWERYRRDYVSFISQNYGILVGNTVLENVESALRFGGMDKEDARGRALAILDEVELREFAYRKAGKLSSGQKQRLSIARALAKPSKILIADEPTGNLDRENSEKIIKLLHKASKDRLVILITHEFSEAQDYATRRIILSDAAVVTDAPLRKPSPLEVGIEKGEGNGKKEKKKTKKRPLFPYVSFLTVKSRPVFSAIVAFFLALTMVITFVFLGTFIIALDDTPTREYNDSAFKNPDPNRIIVMHADGSLLSEEDYNKILGISHVQTVERYADINDVNYYYRPEVDYRVYNELVAGPNYNPIYNPEDIVLTSVMKYLSNDLYLRTVPKSDNNLITEGNAPTGVYEIVSADPNHNIGDKVTVYLKDRQKWAVAVYMKLELTVVGKAKGNEGIYISDGLAEIVCRSKAYTRGLFMPYQEEVFEIDKIPDDFDGVAEGEALLSKALYDYGFAYGKKVSFASLGSDKNDVVLTCEGTVDTTYPHIVLVNPKTYDEITKNSREFTSQAMIYIKDYSYTDRVLDKLADMDYIALSPYRTGATTVNMDLATERVITLIVTVFAFLFSLVLQLILLRAMFNSTHQHYRLMSNIGLTSKTAYYSIALSMLIITLIGEAIGFCAVLIMNAAGLSYVVNIFKYLDAFNILLLFAVHFAVCALSLLSVINAMKKRVFAFEIKDADMDFSLMEEVNAND